MKFNKYDPEIITIESEYFKENSKYYKKENNLYKFMLPFTISEDKHCTNKYGYGISSQNGNYFIDLENKYNLNEYGFRSKEFIKNDEFLIAGCSYTYGIGVPEKNIWGNIVANHFNYNPTNLGVAGASVTEIVNNIFTYCYHYGNPKFILCLFPDFDRFTFPVNNYLLKSKYEKNDKIPTVSLNITPINKKPDYVKRPYFVEDVISSDFAYYLSIKSIEHLIQYCKSSNIVLLWSTWQKNTLSMLLDMIEKNGINYDNFISIDTIDNLDLLNKKECNLHENLKNENPKIFEKGGDYENDDTPYHFGTHQHMHIAESFIKSFKNIKNMPL